MNEHMHKFQKKSGDERTLPDWTSDQTNPDSGIIGKPRKKRIRISWNIAERHAQISIQS